MLRIALTGGIGSGKTTVANMFAQLHVPIIDTDQIAREVVEPNKPGWQAIVAHFGKQIIDSDTQMLNRKQLRELIFANPVEKKWLEDLLHPLIRAEANRQAAIQTAPYCIIVIPLLFESSYIYGADRILVVDTLPEQQIARVTARDQITPEFAQQIVTQQISREQRLAQADDVIDNTQEDLEHLHEQVLALHQKYLALT